jgi:hypothetical protein
MDKKKSAPAILTGVPAQPFRLNAARETNTLFFFCPQDVFPPPSEPIQGQTQPADQPPPRHHD